MSDGNLLALTLGAGGGVALWYLLGGKRKTQTSSTDRAATAIERSQPTTAPPVPCQLRLTKSGLTIDGRATDVPTAVAQCKTAGRADVHIAADAPAAIYAELNTALTGAAIAVIPHRNGRASSGHTRKSRKSTHDVDLADFAATVNALAERVHPDPTSEGLARGRFGVRKVFIAAIRRALRETDYAQLPRTTVDALLVEAMREGLLRLARVDLAAAMDPAEIRDSEIRIVNGSYHFVISEPPKGVDVRTKSSASRKR